MKHELRLLLVALQFLTRVPLPRRLAQWVGYRAEWLEASARYFPLVGAAVGGVAALCLWLAAAWWPPVVAVLLSMAASLVLTGAFHEDGFADVCDGLGGAVDRERALQIMKDSRLGSYGVIGITLLLALKAAALASLPLSTACAALVLAHTVSRAAAVGLMRWLPYAGEPERSKAAPLARRSTSAGWGVALAWPLAALAGCVALAGAQAVGTGASVAAGAGAGAGAAAGAGYAAPAAWLLACAAAAVAAWLCGRWFLARLGGFTGDCLGAAQQVSEVAVYLALLAFQAGAAAA
ncbi:MAG: adenosylcobinamide-GDP ribazoletransferase [Burkholderiales bacterium]|nr:adenosylcobinamide-GDP ribazoletransferase [Burkholderiales bacterium]OJX07451.1 MAG: adenosylcobinamide-GDP ribazoletransferase [Burkholderiales bacterium 70-64]